MFGFKVDYGASEALNMAYTTFGDTAEEHEDRMQSRLTVKPNIEVKHSASEYIPHTTYLSV